MAAAVLETVRQANHTGSIDALREAFPPAYDPFYPYLKENGQDVGPVVLLGPERALLRVTSPYGDVGVWLVDGTSATQLVGLLSVGRSPCHRFLALADEEGVNVCEGWEGRVTARLPWPTGQEGTPEEFRWLPFSPTLVQSITPFPDGVRALLVSPEGVFVLERERAFRIHPDVEYLRREYAPRADEEDEEQEDSSEEGYRVWEPMIHGALSPDGRLMAVGSQRTSHYLYRTEDYRQVGNLSPASSYPKFAQFSADGSVVALHACWMDGGGTYTAQTAPFLTEAVDPERSGWDADLEKGFTTFCGCARRDEIIFGDQRGRALAFDSATGALRWSYSIGSTVTGLDVSQDSKTLLIATYAGIAAFLDLDTGIPNPFEVRPTTTHHERRRWLFWQEEERPLAW